MREEIIDKIAVLMRRKKMNLSKLAKETGISRQTISKIIYTGYGKMLHIEKILKALEI